MQPPRKEFEAISTPWRAERLVLADGALARGAANPMALCGRLLAERPDPDEETRDEPPLSRPQSDDAVIAEHRDDGDLNAMLACFALAQHKRGAGVFKASALLPRLHDRAIDEQRCCPTAVSGARAYLAVYGDVTEFIRLGAYKNGTSPAVDKAIRLSSKLEAFVSQAKDDAPALLTEGYVPSVMIVGGKGREQ
jgi:hypothetical protein